ncbi:MAG: TonB-dependent receptor [Epsilonproteobacteria bacterium (ex Lamellibrachia satsuma)]|nr:MAG: TonB-dependent receptor [Epsilonproteobacteria bacterium (ex Lamellibrachia satsuma)]
MKKGIYLSFVCAVSLQAAQVELGTIDVEAKVDTEVVKDVHGEDIKSADLGEALFKQSPSVSLVRRSGIANDVIVRGQKKDNINVTIDGAKVCGACPNRMDPPVSHILTNNIDYIELNEGPYNVEDFGSLSADVKIHTIKPSKEFSGDVNLGFGSWGYKKGAFSLSGGTDTVRFLLSGSAENSEQYEDGDGNTFAEQVDNYIADNSSGNPKLKGTAYQDKYRDMDAYTKKTLMAKLFWDIADNQELRLSYTANRSDDVLYPNTPMDADYDDSDIYNIEYIAKNLGDYSKKLSLNLYQSEVDHPMSNQYRKSSTPPPADPNLIKHWLTTKMQGAKIKNELELGNHALTVGLDYSLRNWDGKYYRNDNPLPSQFHSIWDVDTKNIAFFMKDKIKFDKWVLDLGLRYDDTTVTTADTNTSVKDGDFNGLSGNIFATYHVDENTKYFAGIGASSRVPDPKELYYYGKDGARIGTFDLDKTTNYEADIGMEKKFENATIKGKVFYSFLKDYIAYNATDKRFENVDATIWGLELSGTYIATDSLYFDYGLAYQRGKKKDPLNGQTDKDLAEIPPLKVNLALNYDYDPSLVLRAEVIASSKWSDFDADNGEQELDAYAVLNLKGTKEFGKNFELTVGVDNVFDKTYAVSNTYKDLTLIAGGGDVMLLNEPGRYIYTNLKYKF